MRVCMYVCMCECVRVHIYSCMSCSTPPNAARANYMNVSVYVNVGMFVCMYICIHV